MRYWGILLLLCCVSGNSLAQDCALLVQTALETVRSACRDATNEQICYGNAPITATIRNTETRFEVVGDIVDVMAVESLSLAGLDENTGEWGIALMNMQGDISTPQSWENLSVLALGDVQIQNQIPEYMDIVTATDGRVRALPQVDNLRQNIINPVSAGTTLQAIGRTEDNEWVFVRLGDRFSRGALGLGWLSTQVIRDADLSGLPIGSAENFPNNVSPFSSFSVQTGTITPACSGLVANGIILQTPQGLEAVSIVINGAQISLQGTAYLTASDGVMTYSVLAGIGYVTVGIDVQPLLAGTQVTVPIDENLLAIGAPSAPQPYPLDLGFLLDPILAPLAGTSRFESIPIALPMLADEIQPTIESQFYRYGTLDGKYAQFYEWEGVPCDAEDIQPCLDAHDASWGHVQFVTIRDDAIASQWSESEPMIFARQGDNTYRNYDYNEAILELVGPRVIRYTNIYTYQGVTQESHGIWVWVRP